MYTHPHQWIERTFPLLFSLSHTLYWSECIRTSGADRQSLETLPDRFCPHVLAPELIRLVLMLLSFGCDSGDQEDSTCDPNLPPSPPVFFGLNGKKRVVLVIVSLVLYEGIYIHGVPHSRCGRCPNHRRISYPAQYLVPSWKSFGKRMTRREGDIYGRWPTSTTVIIELLSSG